MADTDAAVAASAKDDPKVTNGNSSDGAQDPKKLSNGDAAATEAPVVNGKTDVEENPELSAGPKAVEESSEIKEKDESSNGKMEDAEEPQNPQDGEKIVPHGEETEDKQSDKKSQSKTNGDKDESKDTGDKDESKDNGDTRDDDAKSQSEADDKDDDPEKSDTASPSKGDASKDEDPQNKTDDAAGTPKKKKKKKNSALEDDGTPKETRRSSRQRKPVSYVDDVKICPRAEDKGGSDVEMIDEKDPLSVDAETRKGLLKGARRDPQQQNVIVIDTNTLLRNQGNLAAAVAQQTSTSSSASSLHHLNQQINNHSITLTQHPPAGGGGTAPTPAAAAAAPQTPQQMLQSAAQNVSSVGGNLNIGGINLSAAAIANNPAALQNAIAAITGGANAPPGLKNAYITAVQQVLLQQQAAANTTPAGQQYLANLHQYYNTLGALRDEAYVIEAPSFIVPYVMEGKPKESIKEFLRRYHKEQEQQNKKIEEEKEKLKKAQDKPKKPEEKDVEGEKEKEEGDEKKKDKEEGEEKKDKEEEQKKDVEKEEGKEKSPEKKEEKMEVDDEEEKKTKNKEKEEEGEKEEKDSSKEKDGGEDDKKATEDDENKENKDDKLPDDNYEKFKRDDYTHLGRWEGFYKSSLGAFMLDLGLSQAQEFIQADLLKMQKRKLDKMKTQPSRQDIGAVKALDRQLSKSREKNAHLRLALRTCRHCNYRTDSQMVMHRHLESPHMVNYTYKCNFCAFETRGPQVILFHMEAEHMVRGRLERAPAFFQCPLCPFEDNNKSKMTRHSFSCAKKFKPEKNCELVEWEPPAKIPKQISRGRTLPVNTNIKNIGGNLYDASGRSLVPKGLPAGLTMQQLQTAVAQGLLPNPAAPANAANNLNRGRGRPVGSYKTPLTNVGGAVRPTAPGGPFGQRTPSTAPLSQTQQLALAGQLFQGLQSNKPGSKGSGQTPSISITALPRAGGSTGGAAGGSTTPSGVKTATGKDGKPSFVICEICDGYIKDLEQLRNHMNFIHKVKIHPKMIYNRPPLNCQKCQHRFFTDQGLERHLLGTHGLVTSSMQEAANKSKDAGRCPICGKVFQWKLLNHVARDHKMTLKPAHLSYKCTVCTATFNMYRLFENHVYSAHSVVNKQKEGGAVPAAVQGKAANGSPDAPLKINDEITIIPQPSGAKARPLDKKVLGPAANVSKEITITKVGTAPIGSRALGSRVSSANSSSVAAAAGAAIKAGSSVEVISLDESPVKRGAPGAAAAAVKRPTTDSPAGTAAKKAKTS